MCHIFFKDSLNSTDVVIKQAIIKESDEHNEKQNFT